MALEIVSQRPQEKEEEGLARETDLLPQREMVGGGEEKGRGSRVCLGFLKMAKKRGENQDGWCGREAFEGRGERVSKLRGRRWPF